MTTPFEVKTGFYKELFINFPVNSQSAYEEALKSLGIENPEVNNSDIVISPEQFQDKCKKQPEEGVLYLPDGFNADKIAGLLKSENPREAVKTYLQSRKNIGSDAMGGIEGIAQQQKEQQELEQELENFKQDLAKKANKVEEISKNDLENWVKDCDRALLDNILAHYKSESGVKASALVTKRKKVVELVVERADKEIASLIKFSYNEASIQLSSISTTKKEYEVAETEYNKKKEAYRGAKESLKGNREYVAEMSEMLIVADDVEANEMLGREQTRRNLARAKKQRDSIKRRGLIEFSKGVAMATIEGNADAYIATGVKVAEKTKQATENVMRVNPNINPETMEQNDVVLESIIPAAQSMVKQYSNEGNKEVGTNAVSNALLVEVKSTNKNGAEQPQGAGAR